MTNKKRDRLRRFKITYFVGDYYSSDGEEEKSTIIEAENEVEAERLFYYMFRHNSLGWIEEI